VSGDSSLDYSKRFDNEEAVFTVVSHDLTHQQKQSRIDSCKQLLALNDADPAEFFALLMTGDESWFTSEETTAHAMATLRQSSSKKGPTSAAMWETIGISLLGHTRNPAQRLGSSGCDSSEQQHLL
jgi:flavodoxin